MLKYFYRLLIIYLLFTATFVKAMEQEDSLNISLTHTIPRRCLWQGLPEGIWYLIFSFLPPEEVARNQQVCKRWKAIANTLDFVAILKKKMDCVLKTEFGTHMTYASLLDINLTEPFTLTHCCSVYAILENYTKLKEHALYYAWENMSGRSNDPNEDPLISCLKRNSRIWNPKKNLLDLFFQHPSLNIESQLARPINLSPGRSFFFSFLENLLRNNRRNHTNENYKFYISLLLKSNLEAWNKALVLYHIRVSNKLDNGPKFFLAWSQLGHIFIETKEPTELTVSEMPGMEKIEINQQPITRFFVKNLPKLKEVKISTSVIEFIDLNNVPNLENVRVQRQHKLPNEVKKELQNKFPKVKFDFEY